MRQACRRLQEEGAQLQFLDVDREGRLLRRAARRNFLGRNRPGDGDPGPQRDGRGAGRRAAGRTVPARGIPLHLDGVQAVGKMPVDFHALGATALSLGAHKFHGPRGIGALLLQEDARLRPRQLGGHQEADRRAGTEPVALAVGMAVALERWQAEQAPRDAARSRPSRSPRAGPLVRLRRPSVNGSQAQRLTNTLNIAFPELRETPCSLPSIWPASPVRSAARARADRRSRRPPWWRWVARRRSSPRRCVSVCRSRIRSRRSTRPLSGSRESSAGSAPSSGESRPPTRTANRQPEPIANN